MLKIYRQHFADFIPGMVLRPIMRPLPLHLLDNIIKRTLSLLLVGS